MSLRGNLLLTLPAREHVAEVRKAASEILAAMGRVEAFMAAEPTPTATEPSIVETVAGRIRQLNAMTGRQYDFEYFRALPGAMTVDQFAEEAALPLPVYAPDLTRAELIEVVRLAMTSGWPSEIYYMELFDRNVPMPGASSLIHWPEQWKPGQDLSNYDPTPEEIVDIATAPNRIIRL